MSRYDVEKFFPPPDPELICCICQCVLDSAKESPCRHVFCKVCIEQWLNEHNSCPTCRTWLSTQDLQNILPLVQNMINKLVMFCDYRNNGCEQKLMLEMYDAHIQKCEFKLLPCPNTGCNASLLRKDLSQHVNDTCEFREIVCTKGCRLKIPINDLNFHNCMIALKQKSEKQQKLIQEYWKKIQELVSLKDLLKKKVENLLHNIDHSTPVRGESMSNLFSYEEDEDITPISVIPRGEDNTDARLSIISNYFAFYANAVDRITSEVSQIEKEGNVVFNSEFSPVSNSNAFSLLQDADFTPPNIENGQSHRQSDGISTPHNNLGGPMNESLENRERYPLPADSYSDINLDQEIPNNAAEIDNEETGAEDHYNLTDRELDVSYVADSDDGGNDSPVEYSYDNISDNGIFESDEEEDDDDDDFDDIPSDVSSSIQSSLVANVHSESAPDEAETPNEMRNLYEESGDLWSEHDYDNANQSTESVNVHPSNEALPEGDNADVNAGGGESYLHRSEEHYLSSDYISSPSVTSTQYSPVLSSPFHDSDSEMYENNVVMYSDLSDDETNRGILLVLDTEVTFASSTTEQVSHRTTSSSTENNNNNNTHSENSHVLSNDDDDDDDDGSDANNNTDEDNDDCPSSPAENNESNCEEEDPIVEDPHAVSVVQPAYSPPPIDNNVINHMQNTQLNDTSTVNICTSNNKSLATSYNNAIVGRVERPMHQLTMYQHRQRYIEMNSEPVTAPAQHNVIRFLQTGKESVRFSQQDSVAIAETDIPVSIKIEPDEEVEHIISSSDLATVQKTLMSTRTSYNSRVVPACQQVNSTGNDEAKTLNERLMNISNRYTSSAQQTFNNTNANWCAKRSNSSSTETRPLVKRRRTRDYYNSASQAVPMETVCNRVDLSVINVRESPCQLVPKCHRCSRFPLTVTTPAVSPSAIMTPPITTNSLPVSTTACTYSPRLMVNSGRQSLPSGGRTRQSRRRSIREWQASIQSDANDIRVVEERTALSGGSAMENTVGGGQTFRDRRHSHQPEYTVGQADSDDASYEPSDSYSDTDGQESDSSPEVLMPKSFFQLLEEYDSEETDASWTVDMD